MKALTRLLWDEQNRHPGDRLRLFSAVSNWVGSTSVLYPGSFVDIAASFVFDSVIYADVDPRAARFFADTAGVDALISRHRRKAGEAAWRFIPGDYQTELSVAHQSVGLLVSLYAGFVSEYCTRYLLHGGWLLVNPSHGDVAMASIDPRYRLAAVVNARSGDYEVTKSDLDTYLIPKRPIEITPQLLHDLGRSIAYTKSPFAYLFQRRPTDLAQQGSSPQLP